MKLSIVTTLYHSENYIMEFYQRATRQAHNLVGEDYEIIMVDDGSPDRSLEMAVALAKKDSKMVVIELSRNFGHHQAIKIGLEQAKGDLIFLIDSDLEEAPEWLQDFYQVLNEDDLDVVYGVQKNRKGGFFERMTGNIYYRLINILMSIKHPRNITTARLMRRTYVENFLKFEEVETVISCLWMLTGFRQKPYEVKKLSTSKSTYTLFKKIALVFNCILSFSVVPLKLIFGFGLVITTVSLIYSLAVVYSKIIGNSTPDGWTSLLVSIWFIGGVLISSLGVIGLYLSKIYLEVKHRPYALIRGLYHFK